MAKRRVKKPVKQSVSSSAITKNDSETKEPPMEKKEDQFRDEEVERQSAAIRAIRDVEVEQLRTWLQLLRSYFNKEQLQTPVLQFFKENLPNLAVVNNGKDGKYEVQWTDKDGNVSMSQVGGRNIDASLLHRMSIVYPHCSGAVPSFDGFEFSSKAVKASILRADNLQMSDFDLKEPSNTHTIGLQDAFQTPGASSQRFSVGVTPKSLRLPKPGEMLLSVHGSPLGVYKEDNMEAINETEED